MLTITIDNYKQLLEDKDWLIVDSDETYILARQSIIDYKLGRTGSVNHIYIKNHPYVNWFLDLEAENFIKYNNIQPLLILKDKANTIISDILTNEDVVALKLLEGRKEYTDAAILKENIGAFIIYENIEPKKLYLISNFLVNNYNKLKIKYLKHHWARSIEKLRSEIPEKINCLINQLMECNVEFAQLLEEGIYYSDSLTFFDEWLHDNYSMLNNQYSIDPLEFKKFLSHTTFDLTINKKYESKIEVQWDKWLKNKYYTLGEMSGRHSGELNALLNNLESINFNQKEEILKKFEIILNDSYLLHIEKKLRPELFPFPDLKNMNLKTQWEAVRDWATNSYIPFKDFFDNDVDDSEAKLVEENSIKYSDWLIENYRQLLKIIEIHNLGIVTEIRDYIDRERCIILWLIIDGLPSTFRNSIITALKTNGISVHFSSFKLASIPTVTEIGVPMQLNGLFQNSKKYSSDRNKALENSFKGLKTKYIKKLATFKSSIKEDQDIFCFHYYEIDKLLHKQESDFLKSREKSALEYFNQIFEFFSENMRKFTNKKTILVISSDHGATKCFDKSKRIINKNLDEHVLEHHRERSIKLQNLPKKQIIDENEVYILDKNITNNQDDWIVAKGYSYFGKYDDNYRHGGLSPEETIVPFFICKTTDEKVVPLSIKYVGQELKVGIAQEIKMKITNDNEAPVLVSRITITEDQNAFLRENFEIGKYSYEILSTKIKIPKQTLVTKNVDINIVITYSILGTPFKEPFTLSIPLKKDINTDILDLLK